MMIVFPFRVHSLAARSAFRLGVASATAVLFVVAARLADPADTAAVLQSSHGEIAMATTEPDGAYLGVLEGLDHAVQIYATNAGPRFRLIDDNGSVVVSDLRGEEIYRFLPGFEYQSTLADFAETPLLLDGPLMTAEFE
jgi:hypothetical protein